jgi:hypothetical protein
MHNIMHTHTGMETEWDNSTPERSLIYTLRVTKVELTKEENKNSVLAKARLSVHWRPPLFCGIPFFFVGIDPPEAEGHQRVFEGPSPSPSALLAPQESPAAESTTLPIARAK